MTFFSGRWESLKAKIFEFLNFKKKNEAFKKFLTYLEITRNYESHIVNCDKSYSDNYEFLNFQKDDLAFEKFYAYSESARNSGSETVICDISFSHNSGFFLDDIFLRSLGEPKAKIFEFLNFQKDDAAFEKSFTHIRNQ